MVFALVNLVDKVAVERRVWNMYAYTAVIGIFEICIGSLECGLSTWENFNDDNRSMVVWPIVGGLVDGASLYLYFYLLGLTDASIVVGVMYMYPAVVCVLSFFVLDEQLRVFGYLGVIVLLLGAILLSINGIAKIIQKCCPTANILVGLQSMKEKKESKRKITDEEMKKPLVCWYPTPKEIADCLCSCRNGEDDDNSEASVSESDVEMSDAKKWKPKNTHEDDSMYGLKKKKGRSGRFCGCCGDAGDDDTDKGGASDLSELSDISEVHSSTEARSSVEKTINKISKDVGSDEDSGTDSFDVNVISVVVPTSNAVRYEAPKRAAAAGASTTEDSDSAAPEKRHQGPKPQKEHSGLSTTTDSDSSFSVSKQKVIMHQKKKKSKKTLPPAINGYTPKPPSETGLKRPKRLKFQKPPEDSDEDDDADVDSGDDDEDEDETNDEENANNASEGEVKNEEGKEGGEGGEKKKKKSTEPKKNKQKRKKAPMSAAERNKAAKKDVDVPSSKDDNKVGEAQIRNESSSEFLSPKQIEEGESSKIRLWNASSHPHKKHQQRKYRPKRSFDVDDLSSTTDDVRSTDERNDVPKHRAHRADIPRSGLSSEDSMGKKKRKNKSGNNAVLDDRPMTTTTSESEATESESRAHRIRTRARSLSLTLAQAPKKFFGCLSPGALFAILAFPMVVTVGGYEFLIALGAKKGMKTFQVSGVEIMVQGFTLTLGAWFTKGGRKCFPHEFTWNWLFAFLNAALTICSQLLTVYSLTALPAAVSSSLCAIQPLGILILETLTSVSEFRVSQCLAFKLPPIFFIVAGVALLSVDVLFA